MTGLEAIFGGILAAGCLAASAWDAVQRRIPNLLSLGLLVAGLLSGAVAGGWAGFGWSLAHVAAALAAGLALYRFRFVGAGDAKFYAAVAAFFPIQQALPLLFYVAWGGLALVFVWFVYRRLAGKRLRPAGDQAADLLPFGIAISIGAVSAFFLLPH